MYSEMLELRNLRKKNPYLLFISLLQKSHIEKYIANISLWCGRTWAERLHLCNVINVVSRKIWWLWGCLPKWWNVWRIPLGDAYSKTRGKLNNTNAKHNTRDYFGVLDCMFCGLLAERFDRIIPKYFLCGFCVRSFC